VRGIAGAVDFFADGRALVDRFHMDTSATTFPLRWPTGNALEAHLSERFSLLSN
jgi:hypothetical protein